MKKFNTMFLLTIILVFLFGCQETPNDVPFNSLRDVTFQIDLNSEITNAEFDVENDTISIIGDFNNWEAEILTDVDEDGIYVIQLFDLVLGNNYDYTYKINSTLEEIEHRTYTVQDNENLVLDYFNVLIQTSVTLKVNMNYQIELGNFNSTVDFVDVAGNFNDWNGSGAMEETDVENIFEVTYSNMEPDYEMVFKFRINANWDTAEFPDGGSDRTYTTIEGENILEYWYNDEQPE